MELNSFNWLDSACSNRILLKRRFKTFWLASRGVRAIQNHACSRSQVFWQNFISTTFTVSHSCKCCFREFSSLTRTISWRIDQPTPLCDSNSMWVWKAWPACLDVSSMRGVGWLHKVTEDLSGPLPDCFTPPRIDHPGWAGGPDYSLHIYQFPGLSLSPRGWSCESAVASDRCAPILRLFIMAAAPLNPLSLAAVHRSVWQQRSGRLLEKETKGRREKKRCEVKVFFFLQLDKRDP